MKLELTDEKGLIGTIELPVEELRKGLGLDSASADAKLAEETTKLIADKEAEIAHLKEALTEASKEISDEERFDTLVLDLSSLSTEGKARLAESVPGLTFLQPSPATQEEKLEVKPRFVVVPKKK